MIQQLPKTAITIEFPLRHNENLNVSTGGHFIFHVELVRTTATDPLLSQVEPPATVDSDRENGDMAGEMTVPIRRTLQEYELDAQRRKPSRQKRRSTRILSKDDDLVIKLIGKGMTWKQIGKYFPARSVGSLQGRYYHPRRRLV